MLQIKNISKQYKTGDLVQMALDDVSINLRDNEFVAILGPSGSGKTTLLNIIGGLDRYDSGDLIINDISTKKYKDRDWDSYRNHTIGFVFQSYFLIPHQTVLSNVELALTISGVSKAERRQRAIEALDKVGLKDQMHKKPNQMSGGQMQRVAIARALINNPDILLADEPTGALDTKTSIQVMNLLKEVAKDKLVVMVTHNPELAEEYATRIIKLRDGKITDDSDPFEPEGEIKEAEHKNMGKSSMGFGTALALSFNNLKSKKGRTLLTAFAGSIGIIGIALIASLANGVNTYIEDIQKSTMTSYPITIEEQTMDLTSLIEISKNTADKNDEALKDRTYDRVYSNSQQLEMANAFTTSLTKNNLKKFKEYLDSPDCELKKYVGENGIVYDYSVPFDVYAYDSEGVFFNTNPYAGGQTVTGMDGSSYTMSSGRNVSFTELLPGPDGQLVSPSITKDYDVIYGQWPQNYDEVVAVVSGVNEMPLDSLYQLGYLPNDEYLEIQQKVLSGEEIEFENIELSYEELCNKEFYIYTKSDQYELGSNGLYEYIGDNRLKLENRADKVTKVKIVGIVRIKDDVDDISIRTPIAYTSELTKHLIEKGNSSDVVAAQEKTPDVNVLTGLKFTPKDDAQKCEDAKKYLESLTTSDKADFIVETTKMMYGDNDSMMSQINELNEDELAAMFDSYMADPDDEMLIQIYDYLISSGSYDENMSAFGKTDLDCPSSISIYADTFEDKDEISRCIQEYNDKVEENDKITYTDYIGLLLSSVTTIINVISYVLIAFVAVSLVVSSIMIGIITYISVLERTKEIGILRAIGASKKNISLVFNAETFIIGFISGLLGVGISLLLLIPSNILIHVISGNYDVNASLPILAGIILVALSIILTSIGGLIPSRKAANMDPVSALRTE
ncbi:MAG: ABC transporter ATP-binding protein/permease [Clostridiales bacterium]|nr:ABC transporter ATP-binding protein/permease [Clostridiales bacterium]